jgi:hypothetical protein
LTTVATVGTRAYLGEDYAEARAMLGRAREADVPALRAMVLSQVASFKDAWLARRSIAKFLHCSIRTVQRALSQGAELGLIGKARAKYGERLPGMGPNEYQTCGYSHRWTIGRGLAVAKAAAAVCAARAAAIVKRAFNPPKPPAPAHNSAPKKARVVGTGRPARRWTADELEAELSRRAAEDPREAPPEPPERPPD